jgi:hypothetical protein
MLMDILDILHNFSGYLQQILIKNGIEKMLNSMLYQIMCEGLHNNKFKLTKNHNFTLIFSFFE